MKQSVKWIVFTAIIFFVAATSLGQVPLPTKAACCIAGTYQGTHEDIPSGMCNEPKKGKFTMEIFQERNCGTMIKGKITDSSGAPMEFKGSVTAGALKCCTLIGKAAKPGESVTFKAQLCRDKSGKWYSKNGTYKQSDGCEGKFQIYQR